MSDPAREDAIHQARRIIENATDRDSALRAICCLLQDRFPKCDWVGFYLVDPDEEKTLVLGPFVGEPTEHTRIPFGRGICGQVADSGETLVVADVRAETNYLACSVKVRSEIVVPLFVDNAFVAELDIDSHTPNAFAPEDREMLETIARLASRLF